MAKEIKAQAKDVKGSAQKARIVANAVRGMNAMYAMDVLKFMRKGAAPKVRKVVQSAIANAQNNEGLDPDNLVITQIFVDEAVTFKRFRPESKGRVRKIMKRNSHITVFVADKNEIAKDKVKPAKADAEVKEVKTEEAKEEKKPAKKAAAKKTTTKKAESKPKAAKAKADTKSNTKK